VCTTVRARKTQITHWYFIEPRSVYLDLCPRTASFEVVQVPPEGIYSFAGDLAVQRLGVFDVIDGYLLLI